MKKYFKIKNTNMINTIISNVIQYFIDFAWGFMITNISLLIIMVINENIGMNSIIKFIIDAIMIVIALFLWSLLIMPFFPKKVILNNYFITIRRNTFNLDILPGIYKWEISYREIISCEMYNKHYSKSRWVSSGNRFVYLFPSWKNVVVISTMDGKNYFIPMDDPDDFIKNVSIHVKSKSEEDIVEIPYNDDNN